GEVKVLKQQFKQHTFEVTFSGDTSTDSATNANFSSITDIEIIEQKNNSVVVKIGELSGANLLRKLLDANIEITAFREILPTVQQLFIQQVNQDKHA
ncbi:MAG TPA: DUF4162 domain-containing protein, partial [Chitinophagales bacterium]